VRSRLLEDGRRTADQYSARRLEAVNSIEVTIRASVDGHYDHVMRNVVSFLLP